MNTNRLFPIRMPDTLAAEKVHFAPRESKTPGTTRQSLLAHEVVDDRIRHIIVPLDGSAFAEHAIPLALGIAGQCGAMVQLVHVMVAVDGLDPFDALHDSEAALRTLKRRKHNYLSELVDRISPTTSVFVSSRVIDGRRVTNTLDDLDRLNGDLVVMATHGRGAIGRLWRGSVAHTLLQRISKPLILVRGSNAPVEYLPKPIEHVVLPLDGATESEKTLASVLDYGIFESARHTLLQVVRREPKYVARDYVLRTEWMPSRHRWVAESQYLHHMARILRDQGRRACTRIVSSGEPVGQVILRCADENKADLVAIAYRRRGALGRLLQPGVSEYLFRAAKCPLMFVPVEYAS